MKPKASQTLACILSAVFVLFFISEPQRVSKAALDGFYLFLNSVFTVMFPFFVVSAFLVNVGGAERLGALAYPAVSRLFGVSKQGCFAYLISLISGTPVGTKTVCELYMSGAISKDEANFLLPLCSNAGPLFAVLTVGDVFFKDMRAGIIILAVNYLTAALFTAAARMLRGRKNFAMSAVNSKREKSGVFTAFTNAVSSSLQAVLLVGAYIVFFGIVIAFFAFAAESSKLTIKENGVFYSIISSLSEVSAGCRAIGANYSLRPVLSVAAASGAVCFSGGCIIMQCLSYITQADLNVKKFLFAKLFQGVLGFALGFCAAEVFLGGSEQSPAFYETLIKNSPPILIFTIFTAIIAVIFIALIISFLIRSVSYGDHKGSSSVSGRDFSRK